MIYKFITQAANTITFALPANPNNFIRFTADRYNSKSDGIAVNGVRTNSLISTDVTVKKCEDACAPSTVKKRTVRVQTSGLEGTALDLIADLEKLVVVLKANPDYFNGFLMSAGQDITIT